MMKVCRRCRQTYLSHARWCPRCYDDAGRLRPPAAPPLPPREFQVGQRVHCIRDFQITGGRVFHQPAGQVLAVARWPGGSLRATFRPDDWPTPAGQWPDGVVLDSHDLEPIVSTERTLIPC